MKEEIEMNRLLLNYSITQLFNYSINAVILSFSCVFYIICRQCNMLIYNVHMYFMQINYGWHTF